VTVPLEGYCTALVCPSIKCRYWCCRYWWCRQIQNTYR